jgi:hypothetical protein
LKQKIVVLFQASRKKGDEWKVKSGGKGSGGMVKIKHYYYFCFTPLENAALYSFI